MEQRHEVAMIVGAGPGLGFALARRFARAEMSVAMAARHGERLEAMAAECCGIAHGARAYTCDATVEGDVARLFEQVTADLGDPGVVVYNAGRLRARLDPGYDGRGFRALLACRLSRRISGGTCRGAADDGARRHRRSRWQHHVHRCDGQPARLGAVPQPRGRQVRSARAGAEHGA